MGTLKSTPSGKPVRVLIADDDPVLRSLVAANLAARVDSVTEAADGCQAWDLLLNRTFELALIDLSMPNIDGFTLIQCMRGHPRTKHMPIIVITSSSDRDSIERAFEAGATSFLTKPVNWGLFGHHIDYLIRLSQGGEVARSTMHHAEAVARAKDAVIAAIARRVEIHVGRIVELASRELGPRDTQAPGSGIVELALSVLVEAMAITETCAGAVPHLRSVTEQIVVDDRPVLLDRLLDVAVGEMETVAARRDVAIDVGRYHSRITVKCDEAAVARAISCLLRNAIEHSDPDSTVAIRVELRDDNVLAIAVIDGGHGADSEHITKCLRPLDQLVAFGSGKATPTGLGLPLAKAIAQAHGGLLEIVTAPGEGTEAVLILPAEIVEIRHDYAA